MFLPGLAWLPAYFKTGELNLFAQSFLERLWWLAGTFVVFVISLFASTKYLQKNTKALSHLVLNQVQDRKEGFEASGGLFDSLNHAEGVTYMSLRPSGKVMIEGKLYEAQSEGVFITKGSLIRVISTRGKTLIVEERKDC